MTVDSLALPPSIEPPRRGPIPVLAAIVPIGAGVALWLITGSWFALCFAALGPLMLCASLLDARRLRKRELRIATQRNEDAWDRVEGLLAQAHDDERERLRRKNPDVADCLREPPLRSGTMFSPDTTVTIGRGAVRSVVRVTGGDGPRAEEFRRRASMMTDAPIALTWGRGICVRGPAVLADATARALLAQVRLRFGPRQVQLEGDALVSLGLEGFAQDRPRRHVPVLAVLRGQESRTDAEMHLRVLERHESVPDGVSTVIDIVELSRAEVRSSAGDHIVAVECLSFDQAKAIAQTGGGEEIAEAQIPGEVALSLDSRESEPGSLRAAIGRTAVDDIALDLVHEGPHAVVTGMTGTGKSELLVSWVVSMAARYSPEDVVFVLADFKGGTAFEPLRTLPHVAAVMTDLDEANSRRGVHSLTAELRRREGALASAGARDISDIRMPRLVIVVDEFAALLSEHPDLAAVFTDIAARGRALGMHLILGTQRASGVVRDALAANCPLRISLRVTDRADSRAVIGSDDAADIEGGPLSRGLAFIRRPQDGEPVCVRIARTSHSDVEHVRSRWGAYRSARSPWLPPLPARIPLPSTGLLPRGSVGLGVADEPERQRQEWVALRIGSDRGLAFLGGPASGKSSAIRALAEQAPEALLMPGDPERAWDLTDRLYRGELTPSLLLCDNLDALIERYPLEYAQLFVQRWEQVVRAGAGTVVVTAAKAAGGIGRIIDALGERALLRMPSKLDHLAQGGEPDSFVPARPAGRARLRGKEVQLAWVPEREGAGEAVTPDITSGIVRPRGRSDADASVSFWKLRDGTNGVIAVDTSGVTAALALAHPAAVVARIADAAQHGGVDPDDGTLRILVGDGEDWQRHWALCRELRAREALVVSAECAAELRSMLGIKELPPYARSHAGRAWMISGGRPIRVRLPVTFVGSRTTTEIRA